MGFELRGSSFRTFQRVRSRVPEGRVGQLGETIRPDTQGPLSWLQDIRRDFSIRASILDAATADQVTLDTFLAGQYLGFLCRGWVKSAFPCCLSSAETIHFLVLDKSKYPESY